ncbi:MAG: EF-hand domain-containing protein [Porticoccaceae bacterium]
MKIALATLFALGLTGAAFAADYESAPTDPVERYTAIFQQLDEDGSQSLSEEEANAAGLNSESFARLDTNSDKVLSLEEFLVLANEADAQSGGSGATGSDGGTYEGQ